MEDNEVCDAEQKPLEQRRREFLETLAEIQTLTARNGLTPEILEDILREDSPP
jgi:hypothetical protein